MRKCFEVNFFTENVIRSEKVVFFTPKMQLLLRKNNDFCVKSTLTFSIKV